MRLLAVSDEVEEGLLASDLKGLHPDLIASCGDVPFDILGRLAEATSAPLVFVPGNHDPDLSGYRTTKRGLTLQAGMPTKAPWPDGAQNTDGRVIEVAGLSIVGLGGSRRYSGGPNQYSERQQARRGRRLTRRARRKHDRVDLMLAHAPIAGLGDGDDPAHAGFDAFRRVVEELQPRAFLHGHVRPMGANSDHRVGETRVLNVFGHRIVDLP